MLMTQGAVRGSSSSSAGDRRRILVALVAGIGDFVLATPAIRAIAEGFPGTEITFLTTPQAADLARPCPHVREVVTFDLRAYRPGERGTGWGGWRRFREVTETLRSRRFSLAVNLYRVATWTGAIRMVLLLSRIGAERTAGRWSGGRGVIFGVRSPDRPHETDAMLSVAEALGCPFDDATPQLWIPEASRGRAAEHLDAVGVARSAPYVVLHVGSNKPEARLPQDTAADIGREIQRVTGTPAVLTGDPSEAAATERLSARIGGGARSVAGRTDLLELAAILEGARAAVTVDSGPMHLAAAVGTPLVALFGPGDPRRFGPRGRPGQVAVLQGTRHPHDPIRWHTDIRLDDVVNATLERVRGPHDPGGPA
jgi:ADP-heptose:LPS heptosyltransferase